MAARFSSLALVAGLALSLGTFTGCTARYSQSLVGAMPAGNGEAVQSKDTGLSIFQIAVDEPTPAYQQVAAMMQGCKELQRVEVDYRELFILFVGIPSVQLSGVCVK
jgi:hypothetical protein